jgi:F-type H+-transporting ATPase subunit b
MIDISFTMILQWINFLVLLGLLYKLLFRPVTQFLDERKKEIAESINEAKNEREEAQKTREKVQAKLSHIDAERAQLISQTMNEAQKERELLIKKAKSEADLILARAEEERELEIEQAKKNLLEEMVLVSMEASGKVVSEAMDEKKHRQAISETLEFLESQNE